MIILALDVSTSNIGVCVYDTEESKILLLYSVKPEYDKKSTHTDLEKYLAKGNSSIVAISPIIEQYSVEKIVVEEPLLNSNNQKTAKILELFNEYLTHSLKVKYNLPIEFITVNNARKQAFPNILCDVKGKLFGGFPKEIHGVAFKDLRKASILFCVSKHTPTVSWHLNRNYAIAATNFDIADAATVAIAYDNGKYSLDKNATNKDLITFLEKYVVYTLFVKNLKTKELSNEEKKTVITNYWKVHIPELKVIL